jgi:predicted DNA-binding transcriptional regulator AlpA
MNDELIGTQHIANILGITRAWAVGSIIKRPDFPSPAINLSQRIRKWRRSDVVKWVQKTSKS